MRRGTVLNSIAWVTGRIVPTMLSTIGLLFFAYLPAVGQVRAEVAPEPPRLSFPVASGTADQRPASSGPFFPAKAAPASWQLEASPADTGTAEGDSRSLESGGDGGDETSILKMDIDQLARVDVIAPVMNVEVSTVLRNQSTVGRSPAAVYVIDSEMIRRSGARSIPEVLRLVPGLHVARINSNTWSITSRGFASRFSNKLLVQIDGRTVYTPLFSGVYWDAQDVLLEDVERIEVIRGPGASVWGANAVNGIINIITKKSSETQGAFVEGGAGTEERGFASARYGGTLGKDATYRIYGKWLDRDAGYAPDPREADDWRQGRTGFRVDWTPSDPDLVTFQGDYFDGHSGAFYRFDDPFPPLFYRYAIEDFHVSGGNLLTRWTRTLDEDNQYSVQFYYDRLERHSTATAFAEDRDTLDFDFQHSFRPLERHRITWGFGYRYIEDFLTPASFYLQFDPAKRADDLFSYFVQDEITLVEDRWHFIAGCKFEHNDYTGFEYQPTGRLLWTPSERYTIWGAVSRAVRTPSRAEADLDDYPVLLGIYPGPLPSFALVSGDPEIESEKMMAYEIGIRGQPRQEVFWDFTVFFNDYDDIAAWRAGSPALGVLPGGWPAVLTPAWFARGADAQTYGFEIAADYQFAADWKLRGGYSFLRIDVTDRPGFENAVSDWPDPKNQFFLWLSGKPRERWDLDVIGRYVDNAHYAHRYFVMDVRLAWRPRKHCELFVAGRNLLDGEHAEGDSLDFIGLTRTEVQSEVYGGAAWRF